MSLRLLLLLFPLFIFPEAFAQINYKVTFTNPETHYAEVAMDVTVQKDSFDVKMPVWIPGSYLVREFSRNVEGFKVLNDDGKELPFKKVKKNVWRVYAQKKNCIVQYKIYCFELSVRTNYIDIDEAYINGAAFFMYTDETREMPSEITYEPYKEWKIISGSLPYKKNQWVRTASGYDRIADTPFVIGNQDTINVDYKGIMHQVAMVGKAKYDKEKLRTDFYKVINQCTEVIGENPNTVYTFIIHNGAAGGGGLEHLNSCSLVVSRAAYDTEKSYAGFMSLVAHEYFHLWNVKRIRPINFGPFDYENEAYTTLLWFSEGFTNYYSDLIAMKAGYISKDEYLIKLKNNIQNVMNAPGNKIQSVAESSFDAWIKFYRPNENSKNSTVSYYSMGSLIALALNLEIMNSTDGKKSLDDVMKYLYTEYYKKLNRGVTDAELQNAFSKIAGKDLSSFFSDYIYGTEQIPIETYLNYAGISLLRTDGMKIPEGYFGLSLSNGSGKLIVTGVERNSPAWNNGLYVNDEVIAVDNKSSDDVLNYLTSIQSGTNVKFKILRSGSERELIITSGESPQREYNIDLIPKPDEKQEAVRNKWFN